MAGKRLMLQGAKKMTIREIWENSGLTQTELAKKLEIPIRTIEQWCTGKRKPPEYVIKMIEKLLQSNATK